MGILNKQQTINNKQPENRQPTEAEGHGVVPSPDGSWHARYMCAPLQTHNTEIRSQNHTREFSLLDVILCHPISKKYALICFNVLRVDEGYTEYSSIQEIE